MSLKYEPVPEQGQLLTLTVEDYSAVLRDEPIGQVQGYLT